MNSRLYIDSMNAKKKNEEYIHSITGDFLDKVMYLSNKNSKSFYKDYDKGLLEELNEKDLESLYETSTIKVNDGVITVDGTFFGMDYTSNTKVRINKDNSIYVIKRVEGEDSYKRTTKINLNMDNITITSKMEKDSKEDYSNLMIIKNKNLSDTITSDINSIKNNLCGKKAYKRNYR